MKKAAKKKPQPAAARALRPLQVPARRTQTLPNGLRVHVVRRGQLPLVTARLLVRGGASLDPGGRSGLAHLSAQLARRGAAGLSADEISEQIDRLGASLGGSVSEDALGQHAGFRTRDLDAVLALLAQVSLDPTFPDHEVELARRRALAQVANDLDDPSALAEKALVRAVYGDHPYGREIAGDSAGLRALSRADLSRYHREQCGPKVADLFLVGDLDPDHALRAVERTFGAWESGPLAAPVLRPVSALGRPGEVLIVDKPEQTQVQVRVAGRGMPRGQPDHFHAAMMSTVLGGGFTSRLVTEIRVKRGLTYGAGCHFEWMKWGGSFTVSSFTRSESLETLLDVALAEVDKMRAKGPTAKELGAAQRYVSGLYPARLETNDALAGAFAEVELHGLPDDWIAGFRERVMAVTADEAHAAARKYLFDPAGTDKVIVLVGNAAKIRATAERYGKVSVLQPAELA